MPSGLIPRDFPWFDIGNDGFGELPGTAAHSARNQNGLTTQLLICAATGLLFFLIFCFLRTRERWAPIFAPRMHMKRHKPPALPNTFFGWILPLLKIDNREIMYKVGLDAVVMLQFLTMAIKLFGICSVFGIATLVPISVTNGNVTQTNLTGQIDNLAITVLDDSSSFLIAYLVYTYLFCFLTFFFVHQNFHSFLYLRARYLLRVSKTLSCRTVVVTGIPRDLRSDEKLADYYSNLGLGSVVKAHMVRQIKDIDDLLKKRVRALRKLETAYATYWGNPCRLPDYDPDKILMDTEAYQDNVRLTGILRNKKLPETKTGFLGLWGERVESIQYYTEMFNQLDRQVEEARDKSSFDMTNVGFVTFDNMQAALIASQIAIHPEPFHCRTKMAFEPRDVLWGNVAIRGRERILREIIVWTITIALSVFWVVPISIISTFTSLETLLRVFPSVIRRSTFVQNLLQGLVPTLLVNIFMAVLPLIFDSLGVVQGLRSHSAIARATFSNTVLKTIEQLWNHPSEIANLLGTTLPAVAPFFINYTVLQGMLLMPLNLLLLGALIVRGFNHFFLCKTPRDHAENRAPWAFNYGTGYPPPLLIFIIVLAYSTISPIILLFGTVYFCIAYLVYKYQFLYVYFQPYDAVGDAWTMVFPRIIVGMIIFQLTMAGIFILKDFITLGVLCIPLIVITILFKIGIDAAYKKNCDHLPMQVLQDKVHNLPSCIPGFGMDSDDDSDDGLDDSSSSSSEDEDEDKDAPEAIEEQEEKDQAGEAIRKRWRLAKTLAVEMSSNPRAKKKKGFKRVILDEDDYAAIPDRYTDYRQSPMKLTAGILDTGLKAYINPALIGVLPQLWLPISYGKKHTKPLSKSKRYSARHHHLPRHISPRDVLDILHRAQSFRHRENDVAATATAHPQQPQIARLQSVQEEISKESSATDESAARVLHLLGHGGDRNHEDTRSVVAAAAASMLHTRRRKVTLSREHMLKDFADDMDGVEMSRKNSTEDTDK
ncbi:hypothetical protein BX666DRAFT_227509 [Dichotomocladium elegans]|nr:hypothetical protein BX666DRAFT_227509 [Dichotomocladium elegans]